MDMIHIWQDLEIWMTIHIPKLNIIIHGKKLARDQITYVSQKLHHFIPAVNLILCVSLKTMENCIVVDGCLPAPAI